MEISGKTRQYHLRSQQAFIDRDDRLSKAATAGSSCDCQRDDVDLSTRGSMIHRAMQNVQNQPDVRTAKVDAIRQMLSSGTYRFEGDRIAIGLMAESEENNTILNDLEAGNPPETEGL